MERRDVANLAFKIAGLYCWIEGLSLLPSVMYLATSGQGWSGVSATGSLGIFLSVLLYATGGFVLVIWSRPLAQKMFPDPPTAAASPRFLALHAFAYSVLGIYVSVNGLISILWYLADWTSSAQTGRTTPGVSTLLMRFLPGTVELGLGFALFFGSHGLVRLWSRLRYAGIRRQLGMCAHCGYDLTGNSTGTCPECGTAIYATQES